MVLNDNFYTDIRMNNFFGLKIYKQIYNEILTNDLREKGKRYMLLFVLLAFFELLGAASVLPFLSFISDPNVLEKSSFMQSLYKVANTLGFKEYLSFSVFLGFSSFLLLLISAIFRTFSYFLLNRYVELTNSDISSRILISLTNKEYTFFVKNNSSDLVKRCITDVDLFTNQVFKNLLLMVSQSFVVLA